MPRFNHCLNVCALAITILFAGPLIRPAGAGVESKECGTARLFEGRTVSAETARARAGFALDLIGRLSSGNKNVAVSPFGLSAVLSTLDLGASPALRKAITATLHLSQGGGGVEDLRREARLIELSAERDPQRFASFNAVLVDNRLTLKPGIQDLARAEGNIELQSIDFSSGEAIAGINAMLAAKTKGRISSILEPGSAPTLVAVNAMAFKDCWRTAFDTAKTADKPFTRPDGSSAQRATMTGTIDQAQYRAQGRFHAVELPYLDENFVLTLVTTQRDTAKAGDFKEAAALLAGLDLGDVKATLSLPKFEERSDNDMLETLSAMGLKAGLATSNQLPGLADGLAIGRVRQKAWLSVNEAGTEAAALTAVEVTRSAITGPKEVTVKFDRPFVYALRYRPTGTILMAGYVADPAPAAQPEAAQPPAPPAASQPTAPQPAAPKPADPQPATPPQATPPQAPAGTSRI